MTVTTFDASTELYPTLSFASSAAVGSVGSPGSLPTDWWAVAGPLAPAAVWTPNGETGTDVPPAHGTGPALVKWSDVPDLPTVVPGLAGEWGADGFPYSARVSLDLPVLDTVRQGAFEVVARVGDWSGGVRASVTPYAYWTADPSGTGTVDVGSTWAVAGSAAAPVLEQLAVDDVAHLLYQWDRDAGTITGWLSGQKGSTFTLDASKPLSVVLGAFGSAGLLFAWYDHALTDADAAALAATWAGAGQAPMEPGPPFGHATPGLGVSSLQVMPPPMDPPPGYGDYLVRQTSGVPGPPTLDASGRPVDWTMTP